MSYLFMLELRELQLRARLGIYDWERDESRIFPLNVKAAIQCDESIDEDALDATLDYSELEEFILFHGMSKEWHLVERLLATLASAAFEKFPRIQNIHLTLEKPQALPDCEVAVEYFAERK